MSQALINSLQALRPNLRRDRAARPQLAAWSSSHQEEVALTQISAENVDALLERGPDFAFIRSPFLRVTCFVFLGDLCFVQDQHTRRSGLKRERTGLAIDLQDAAQLHRALY